MSRQFLPILTVAALLWPVASFAQDSAAPTAETSVTAGAELDYVSRYIWRGLPLSRGMVQQSSIWVTAGDVTFTAWNNLVLGREENRHRINEVDLSVETSRTVGAFTIEPSFLYYTYPHQADAPATGELSVNVSRESGPLTLFTSQTFDVMRYRGAYYGEAGISRHWDAPRGIGIDGSASVGWASRRFNDAYAGVDRAGVDAGTLSVSSDIPAGRFTVRPHLAWTALLDRDLRESISPSRNFSVGIAIDREFP